MQQAGVRGYAHVIKEDTRNPNLLFLGTEFGLWVSVDGGQRWAQYKGTGFPAVAVRDLVVHPRTSDLVMATHGRGIWIIDDITPWRALTNEVLTEDAGFLPVPPAVQWLETFAGWAEGDATFHGPSKSTEASIPYYQRSRHIYGDLKIEILDQQGKLVDVVPTSKHRGVSRATWSMHVKPPRVPPAAVAAFGAAVGPRIVPGTYTVRMTRGEKVYNTQLTVALDPRSKFTVEDRKQQFDLMTKIGAMLNRMTGAVEAILATRDGALSRAAKLPEGDPLRRKLTDVAASVDQIRTKIVATKEGGAITGEERLREFLAGLYGDVGNYEGRPTDSQVARADALGRELEDVIREFTTLTAAQLPALNRDLQAKKLLAMGIPAEKDWQ